MILLIDNYDSFTYNIYQYLGELGADIKVFRNDAITIEESAALDPKALVISPGPCGPDKAGISMEIIKYFSGKIPILGVCLGHQAIGATFGGKITRAFRPIHGKTSLIFHDGKTIYRGLPNPFQAVRYHSLVVDRQTLPECFTISAETESGEIMGIRHHDYCLEGVQFHPESIITTEGKKILSNFLKLGRLGETR